MEGLMAIGGGLILGIIIGYIISNLIVKKARHAKIEEANKKADLTIKEAELAVQRKLNDAETKAESLLKKHLDKLHALAAALLEYEILDAEQVDMVLAGKKLPAKKEDPDEKDVKAKVKPKAKTKSDSERESKPKTEKKESSAAPKPKSSEK